jgi:hypothetical protein
MPCKLHWMRWGYVLDKQGMNFTTICRESQFGDHNCNPMTNSNDTISLLPSFSYTVKTPLHEASHANCVTTPFSSDPLYPANLAGKRTQYGMCITTLGPSEVYIKMVWLISFTQIMNRFDVPIVATSY